MKNVNLEAKITFDDTVTYRDINLRDHVGTIVADDKRTASSAKLWLVRWNDGIVGVEHVANLARVDEVEKLSDSITFDEFDAFMTKSEKACKWWPIDEDYCVTHEAHCEKS